MPAHIPPGWPAGVHPPGSDGFETTAVAWLLDVVPPDYRLYGVLRRHPVALATMARHHLAAAVQGARQGYRMARTELTQSLPPHAVEAVLTAYRREGRRLVAASRSVEVVERALRGETFRPRINERLGRQPPAAPATEAPAPAHSSLLSRRSPLRPFLPAVPPLSAPPVPPCCPAALRSAHSSLLSRRSPLRPLLPAVPPLSAPPAPCCPAALCIPLRHSRPAAHRFLPAVS